MRKLFVILSILILASLMVAAAPASRVCVFVPGVVSGSPIYEQLVSGAKRAVAEVPGASLKVVEGGFNQADWLGKLSALAATGEFSLIVSSNAAIPDLCAQVAASFPSARFFVADSWLPGNKSIHTVLYNQLDQGYMVGYLAGLASAGKLPGSGPTIRRVSSSPSTIPRSTNSSPRDSRRDSKRPIPKRSSRRGSWATGTTRQRRPSSPMDFLTQERLRYCP